MSNDMQDDELKALRQLQPPPPTEAARRRALDAALLAFDAEQEESAGRAQGSGWRARLKSIVPKFEGNWIMDTRIPFGLGTAAVALLLLPLGYQLYNSTAITPPRTLPAQQPEMVTLEATPPEAAPVAPDSRAVRSKQAAGSAAADQEAGPMTAMPMAESASAPLAARMPAPPSMLMAPAEPRGDSFTAFEESPLKLAAEDPVSTFSIDVDTASYAYVRRLLRAGQLPEPDAVRVEELLNYFSYDYPAPETAETPFRTSLELYPTPWNAQTRLLQIGIKGYVPPAGEDRASNLVFLLDTSGSMEAPDRLPLLKRAFGLLVDQLSDNDTVSIVAYAGAAGGT
jgi:Ca-activated chloride channel family protein